MEIRNKELFKDEIKSKIDRYVKQFPLFFYGNICVNLALIVIVVFVLFFSVMSVGFGLAGFVYGVIFSFLIVTTVLRITFKNFLKNVYILNKIREGNYDFGIEDFEMDNAMEFLEGLPLKKTEVEDMRKELSFDKIIDVLETVGIISCENGIYAIDLIFKNEAEEEIKTEIKEVKDLSEKDKKIKK